MRKQGTPVERITTDNWTTQCGHIDRYILASEWVNDGEVVLDAACGIGYGSQVLTKDKKIQYFGVDTEEGIDKQFLHNGWFSAKDLETWTPKFEFDVAICFETLEHLKNYSHMVSWLKLARRMIIVSVPTVPTKHFNPYHLHDFTVEDILQMFSEFDVEVIPQPIERSHIFKITKREEE